MRRRVASFASFASFALAACAPPLTERPPIAEPEHPDRLAVPSDAAVPSSRPPPLAPSAPRIPVLEEGRLANGVRVLVYPDTSVPLVSVAFVVTRGGAAAPPGVGALFANGLLGASGKATRNEALSQLQFLAASTGVAGYLEGIVVRYSALAPLWTTGFRYLTAMLSSPRFESEDIEREKRAMLARRAVVAADPASRAKEALHAMLYGPSHPLTSVASAEHIKASTPAMLRAYRDANLAADTLTIVAAGPVTLGKVIIEAEDELPDLPARAGARAPVLLAARPERGPRLRLLHHSQATQATFAIGVPGVSSSSPDRAALELLAQVLGGSLGGRLSTKVRSEQGLTYGISVTPVTFRDTGHVVLSTAVTHARAPEALRLILAELDRVTREPLGDEELERGKRSLLSRLSTSYEGPIAATATIADLVIEGVTDRRVLAGAIRGLGTEEVRRVAAKYFDPTQLQIAVVADASTLQVPLRALGLGPLSVE